MFSRKKYDFRGKKSDFQKNWDFQEKKLKKLRDLVFPECFITKLFFEKKIVNRHGAIVSSSPAGLYSTLRVQGPSR